MEFLIENVKIEDRHTEPDIWKLQPGMPIPAMHEEVTLTIKLVGSGDTRKFSNIELVNIIMQQLEHIKR